MTKIKNDNQGFKPCKKKTHASRMSIVMGNKFCIPQSFKRQERLIQTEYIKFKKKEQKRMFSSSTIITHRFSQKKIDTCKMSYDSYVSIVDIRLFIWIRKHKNHHHSQIIRHTLVLN